MIPRFDGRRVRRLASLLVAFGLAAAAWPSAARASCGDYVTYGGHAHATMPGDAHPSPTTPAEPRQPCRGPHCSRIPVAPAPAPAVPVTLGGDEWACSLPPPLTPENESARLSLSGAPARGVARASDVFHPPRSLEPSALA